MKTVTTFTIDELLDVLVNSPEVVKVAERLGYKNWKVRLTFDDEIVTGFEFFKFNLGRIQPLHLVGIAFSVKMLRKLSLKLFDFVFKVKDLLTNALNALSGLRRLCRLIVPAFIV